MPESKTLMNTRIHRVSKRACMRWLKCRFWGPAPRDPICATGPAVCILNKSFGDSLQRTLFKSPVPDWWVKTIIYMYTVSPDLLGPSHRLTWVSQQLVRWSGQEAQVWGHIRELLFKEPLAQGDRASWAGPKFRLPWLLVILASASVSLPAYLGLFVSVSFFFLAIILKSRNER